MDIIIKQDSKDSLSKSSSVSSCPICLDQFDNVIELPCKHKYCYHCILNCYYHKPVCPYCGRQIPPELFGEAPVLNENTNLRQINNTPIQAEFLAVVPVHQNYQVRTPTHHYIILIPIIVGVFILLTLGTVFFYHYHFLIK